MDNEEYHIPVLLNEVLDSLDIENKKLIVDGTLGGAGHTTAMLKANKKLNIIGFDRDPEAVKFSKNRTSEFGDRIKIVNQNFKTITEYLKDNGIKADGILLDLGVSSHQIDDEARGFSFRFDSKLDMRMNQNDGLSAFEVVNEYTEEDLANVIYNYGEERLSRKIAKDIVANRPVETTFKLKQIVEDCVKRFNIKEVRSSVQRVFQAIRIEVNAELDDLNKFILSLPDVLNSGARISIITFHSLEDRIVKQAFADLCTNCICPPSLPVCVCNHKAKAKYISKKPIIAGGTELAGNSRASSAKLRVIEII